jgi:hypothetical protein
MSDTNGKMGYFENERNLAHDTYRDRHNVQEMVEGGKANRQERDNAAIHSLVRECTAIRIFIRSRSSTHSH